MTDEEPQQQTQFMSPTDFIKNKEIGLMFDTINHDSRSMEQAEKYAFIRKAKYLSILLERYTKRSAREETRNWYDQLREEERKIREENPSETKEKKNEKIMDLRYQYALEINEQSARVLMNSPIVEIDVEGDLDINDADVISIVRGEKRIDAGTLVKS